MSGTPTLYVETNFLVGHARGEAEEYETILSAAEANRIALVVPVFGFYEALSKFGREREDREKWATQLDRLGAELDRKKVNPERSSAFREAADHLRKLVDVHSTGLNEIQSPRSSLRFARRPRCAAARRRTRARVRDSEGRGRPMGLRVTSSCADHSFRCPIAGLSDDGHRLRQHRRGVVDKVDTLDLARAVCRPQSA